MNVALEQDNIHPVIDRFAPLSTRVKRAHTLAAGLLDECLFHWGSRLEPAGYVNVVYYLNSTGGSGHAGGGAFMLTDRRAALPGDDTVGDFESEAVLADFGF